MNYAIVKTGGKQYRVEEGDTLLVERLPDAEGAKVALEPLMVRSGDDILDGDGLSKVKVEAKVIAHERGPKIRVFKFKPKRGYKRTQGHRQELTRLEVTGISQGARRAAAKPKAAAEDKPKAAAKPKAAGDDKPKAAGKPRAKKPAPKKEGA